MAKSRGNIVSKLIISILSAIFALGNTFRIFNCLRANNTDERLLIEAIAGLILSVVTLIGAWIENPTLLYFALYYCIIQLAFTIFNLINCTAIKGRIAIKKEL
jgi:hypothetical protein